MKRKSEPLGHWADLRSGDMAQCNGPEPKSPGSAIILIIFASAFALVGFAAGYALGDVPEYTPAPGYEMCKGSC